MTNPILISTPFATAGGKNPIQESVPLEPNNPTWVTGFPTITSTPVSEGGLPPKRLDFNGVLNAITQNIVHQSKGLSYEFDAAYATKIGGYPLYAELVLSNGDKVKNTVPNNSTNPNIDMTGWKKGILASDVMYGDKNQQQINDALTTAAPYTANNYPSINDAVQQSPLGNTVHLNIGEYTQAIDLNKVNLQGKGYGTVLKVQPNSYGIKSLQTGSNWDRMRVSDIAFKGVSRVGTVGFQFDPADPFAGRRNIEYCTFDNLDIAIHKPKGNIGNAYSSISVSNSNYGYRVKSSETPLMHAGNDRFVDAQFNGIDKWAIDLENTSGSDGFGQFTVDNSIFQFSNGGGVRLDMGGVVPTCPPVIKNTWFEEIATPNTTVDRDGVLEAPREIKLINCPIVFVEGCYLKNIELINSTMITKGCRIDAAATTYNIIVKDANSQIFADDVYMDGGISTNVTVRSVAKQKRVSYGAGGLTFLSTPINNVISKPSNSESFTGKTFRDGVVGATTWAITGSQTVFATCVDDGGEAVAKLPMQTGITNVVGSFGIHNNMWIVWGFSVKPLSALTGTFDFKNSVTLGDITMNVGKWTHNVGIAKSGVTGYVAAWLQPSSNGDLLIKDYFCAEFVKEEDALNFVNSRNSIKETS